MKKLVVAVLVVAALAISGMAMAQGRGMGPGYGPGGPGYGPRGPAAEGPGLNLSQEQIQKMQTMREGFWKENLPLRSELNTKRLELQTLWAQANPDEEKILAKQKEINALRVQMQEKATKHRLEMRKVLTPEQQAQLGAFRGAGSCGMGYGPKGGRGPGRGMGMGFGPRW